MKLKLNVKTKKELKFGVSLITHMDDFADLPTVIDWTYKYTYDVEVIWHLNSDVKGLIESATVRVNGEEVACSIGYDEKNYLRVYTYICNTPVELHTYWNKEHDSQGFEWLEDIDISYEYQQKVERNIFLNITKPCVEQEIAKYEEEKVAEKRRLEEERIAKEKRLHEAFVRISNARDVYYFAEVECRGIGSPIKQFLFSDTKEYLENKKQCEFDFGDSYYRISEPKLISEFPYWEQASKDIRIVENRKHINAKFWL